MMGKDRGTFEDPVAAEEAVFSVLRDCGLVSRKIGGQLM